MSKPKDFQGKKIMVKPVSRLRVNSRGVFCLAGLIFFLAMGSVIVGCKKTTPTPTAPPAAPKAAATPKAAEVKAPEVTPQPREAFHYSAAGRRDPFVPLVVGRAAGEKVKGDPKRSLEVGDLKLVGIVWDKGGYYYALVETPQGLGYTLKKNDRIGVNTVVSKITRDAIHFLIRTRAYTGARSEASEVVLKLRKED